MFKNAIFDVDGTLINSFDGVTKSVRYAIEKMGESSISDEIAASFIGPSLFDSFTNTLHYPEQTAKIAIEHFRARYNEIGVYECSLYEGMRELLIKLKAENVLLSVASSKPSVFIKKLFDKFEITSYFDSVQGVSKEERTSDKKEMVKNAILDKNAVMIGDRKYDFIAAKQNNIFSIGVTFGFAPKGEFEEFKPDFIAKDTDEIFDIVLKN